MNILITGASSGIGLETAKAMSTEGHTVGAVARRADRLAGLKGDCSNVQPLVADVTDPEQVESVVARFIANHGEIDVLVNNAGLALGKDPAHQADRDSWRTMIEVNCLGLANVTHAIVPAMANRKRGLIINVGSVAGSYTYPGGNVYGATKAFARQFSLNLRTDLHGTGVRVCNLEPGTVAGSEFSIVRNFGDEQAAAAVYEGWEPLSCEDIAKQIVWVASLPEHININILETMPTGQSPSGFRFA